MTALGPQSDRDSSGMPFRKVMVKSPLVLIFEAFGQIEAVGNSLLARTAIRKPALAIRFFVTWGEQN
jgi:hypothetical protein